MITKFFNLFHVGRKVYAGDFMSFILKSYSKLCSLIHIFCLPNCWPEVSIYPAVPAIGHHVRAAESGFGPPSSEGGPVKYFYAKLGRLAQLQSSQGLV